MPAGLFVGAAVLAGVLSLAVGAPTARADEPVASAPPATTATTDAAAENAATTATPVPTPSDDPARTTTPTITSPNPDELITTGSTSVRGSRDAANEIQVFPPHSTEPACIVPPSSSAAWGCASVPLVSGPQQTIRVIARNVISNATETASVTVSALTPPVITGPSPSNGMVSGNGAYPDATVTVTAGAAASCTVQANATGVWACFLTQSDGTGLPSDSYTVSASQTASFASSPSEKSATAQIVIDSTPPAAPVITSPRNGTHSVAAPRVTFSGTGEDGATVNIDSVTKKPPFSSSSICEATVKSGHWSCTGKGLPAGSYDVTALQIDAVGNPSRASAITLSFTAATTPPKSPTQPPSHAPGTHAPGSVAPPSQVAPAPDPSHTATPAPTPTPTPGVIPPNGGGFDGPNAEWLATTPYTSTSPPTIAPDAFPGWLRALLLAVVALLLLALPARLLAGALSRSRVRNGTRARSGIFGRNRSSAELPSVVGTSAAPRWLVGATVLVATAALVTLSSSASNQPAYLRLLAAVAMAVVVVNAVWALIGMLGAGHLGAGAASVVIAPRALFLVALAALLSRFADLSPALLFGLVLGVAVSESATTMARGRLAATQLAGLSAIGLIAWMLTAMLPAVTNPVAGLAAEVTNAVAIISIGSAAVSLVPIGRLAGRAVFAWSRPVWLGLSLVIGTVFFALLVPVDALWRAGGGGILIVGAGIGFAGVSLAAWLWMRYIEPAR
jgi:hypothetical protein